MTDEIDARKRAVAGVLSGVTRKTAVVVSVAAIAALVMSLLRGDRWWFLATSVLFGGVLGLLNFRWLAIAVQRVYLRDGATQGTSQFAAAIINILKLSVDRNGVSMLSYRAQDSSMRSTEVSGLKPNQASEKE